MRMSLWMPLLTSTGCLPAGKPFGNKDWSEVGTGSNLYGKTALATAALSIGTINVAGRISQSR